MTNSEQLFRTVRTGVILGTIGLVPFGAPAFVTAASDEAQTPAKVKVIQPQKGDLPRVTAQPCSIWAFESVHLFSRLPGMLKSQTVDIGDRVKRGQVLAVLEAPDLEAQVQHDHAVLDQARSRVVQAKTRVVSVEAAAQGARAALAQAEAAAKGAAASARRRKMRWKRMKELFAAKTVEECLLDESQHRYDAALESEQSAKAAVATINARAAESMANIEDAKAGLAAAEAGVKMAEANLHKSQVQLSFATITTPIDGVVTQRGYVPGDFIRSANREGHNEPLLTVQRTDLMRVVVSIPDRDVPFIAVGDPATVEIEALPGKKWSAKVSRTAAALDPKIRSMRVEIDLPNPTGQLRAGMYGRCTIVPGKLMGSMLLPSLRAVTPKLPPGTLPPVELPFDPATPNPVVLVAQEKNVWIDTIGGNQYFVGVQDGGNNLQPGQPQGKDGKLQKLLEERLATAREYAKQVTQRVKNLEGSPEELMEASRVAFEAELELCTSNKERITVLEKFLGVAKENESILVKFSNRGQIRQSAALKAKTERLQVEIALERAKAKAAVKSADASASQELIRYQLAVADKQVAIKRAAFKVAQAQVTRAVAKLATYKALVEQARAFESLAERQVKRFEDLARTKAIDVQLVEERVGQWEATKARRMADEGNVAELEAQVAVQQARVDVARQEFEEAELRMKLLQTRLSAKE